jgi:hypothetical protein
MANVRVVKYDSLQAVLDALEAARQQALEAEGPPGPVGLTWRGEWDTETTYAERDAVSHQGSAYIAMAATATGDEPGVSNKWHLIAAKGEAGGFSPGGQLERPVLDRPKERLVEHGELGASHTFYYQHPSDASSSGLLHSATLVEELTDLTLDVPILDPGEVLAFMLFLRHGVSNSDVRLFDSEQTEIADLYWSGGEKPALSTASGVQDVVTVFVVGTPEGNLYSAALTMRGVSVSTEIPPELPTGYVHLWAFDTGSGTTLVDSAGTLDIPITGAAWVPFGLDFVRAEEDSAILATPNPTSAINQGSDFTVSILLKPRQTNYHGIAFLTRQNSAATRAAIQFRSGSILNAWVYDTGANSTLDVAAVDIAPFNNTPVLVTMRWDAGEQSVTLWLNDTLPDEVTPNHFTTGANGIAFGASTSGQYHYDGLIGYGVIWPRLLSDAEIVNDLYPFMQQVASERGETL